MFVSNLFFCIFQVFLRRSTTRVDEAGGCWGGGHGVSDSNKRASPWGRVIEVAAGPRRALPSPPPPPPPLPPPPPAGGTARQFAGAAGEAHTGAGGAEGKAPHPFGRGDSVTAAGVPATKAGDAPLSRRRNAGEPDPRSSARDGHSQGDPFPACGHISGTTAVGVRGASASEAARTHALPPSADPPVDAASVAARMALALAGVANSGPPPPRPSRRSPPAAVRP